MASVSSNVTTTATSNSRGDVEHRVRTNDSVVTCTVDAVSGTVTSRVPARVGLVGNPSDGHGGAVVATVVPALAATVSVRRGEPEQQLPPIISVALDALAAHLQRDCGQAGAQLLERPLEGPLEGPREQVLEGRIGQPLGEPVGPLHVEWTTTIPVSVGLAGSSALAIAAIDAAATLWGHRLDRRVLAALALAAEVDGLGVAAGWQDRIAQSLGGTVLVDAAQMSVVDGLAVPAARRLRLPVLVELVVAWHAEQASGSGGYHGHLRSGGGQVADAMSVLAVLARTAAAALEDGDLDGFADAVDETWRVRQEAAPLRADHAALVESIRTIGAPATTPGSGGSVVAVVRSPAQRAAALAAVRDVGATAIMLQMQ
ncbi:MAG: hypothetical protein ABIR68_02075 [Ilumatobacteraceae bacterium]